jgi:hypothetical protein
MNTAKSLFSPLLILTSPAFVAFCPTQQKDIIHCTFQPEIVNGKEDRGVYLGACHGQA